MTRKSRVGMEKMCYEFNEEAPRCLGSERTQ